MSARLVTASTTQAGAGALGDAAGLRRSGLLPAARIWSAAAPGSPPAAPLVAVLCVEPRARAAAAGVALALARAADHRCALAGAVGVPAGAAIPATPAAHRAAATLRRRGLVAGASGRLVWLPDRRGALPADDVPSCCADLAPTDDLPSRCAALGAELGRAATALRVPAAVAFPVARTDALDRVLAWHDAIVLVREPDAPSALVEPALASLARLGRPAVAMAVPRRSAATFAAVGLAVPPEAATAVAELLQAGLGRPGGSRG